jgi:hypothetical protein
VTAIGHGTTTRAAPLYQMTFPDHFCVKSTKTATESASDVVVLLSLQAATDAQIHMLYS